MRRPLVAALPALALLLLAAPAPAAPTYDLGRADRWKPGDVLTTTVKEEQQREVGLPGAAETAVPPRAQRVKLSWVLVTKCLEADPDGNATKWLLYFPSWAAESGAKKDTCLEGGFIEVAGRGTSRTWKTLWLIGGLSKDARAWLERQYGAGRPGAEAARRTWLPQRPVAAGDVWTADLAGYLETLPGVDHVDRDRATSTCKLTSVEGGVAKVACEAKLPFKEFPGGKAGQPMPWTKGGTQVLRGTIGVAVEGRLVASSATWESVLEGEASAEGRTVTLVLKSTRTVETKLGGEMPEPPAAPPAPEAPKEPAAPAEPATPGMDAPPR